MRRSVPTLRCSGRGGGRVEAAARRAMIGACGKKERPRPRPARRALPATRLLPVLLGLLPVLIGLPVAGLLRAAPLAAQLLVPMDDAQSNHLKAYGLAYRALAGGERVEWLLNYRHGSFLLPDTPGLRDAAALMGVAVEPLGPGGEAAVRGAVEERNAESVPLEKAPRIGIYTAPNASPWDDAVSLALTYAEIPFERIWDREVLAGGLSRYDWIHLHHEDFTGQYSKFYLTYAGTAWLREEVARNEAVARALGYADVPALKKAVAAALRRYVEEGGFLFAMCTATETLELALAAGPTDIAASFADGSPPDPRAEARMDWGAAMAFEGAALVSDPTLSAFSDIDGHQVNTPWRRPLSSFALFDFSAKFDPVPSMLTQSHERVLHDFYGLTTTFRRERLKPGVTVLAEDGGEGLAKYIHGARGEGTFTFLGGHDPEDPRHLIGDPPTDLDLHRHSPGYRLILNNVLFPAAREKKLKT